MITNTCKLCLAKIDRDRIARSNSLKYCSTLCNKRAWYIRNTTHKRSIFSGNPILGIEYENWFIEKFGAVRPSRNHNTPSDFLFEGKRVDLKVANRGRGDDKRWCFRKAGKRHKEVDEYICLLLNGTTVLKMLRIPAALYPLCGLRVMEVSPKWDLFVWEP